MSAMTIEYTNRDVAEALGLTYNSPNENISLPNLSDWESGDFRNNYKVFEKWVMPILAKAGVTFERWADGEEPIEGFMWEAEFVNSDREKDWTYGETIMDAGCRVFLILNHKVEEC